jgi:hypothetical protein
MMAKMVAVDALEQLDAAAFYLAADGAEPAGPAR